MPSRLLLTALLAAAFSASRAADPPPVDALLAPFKALRANDLAAWAAAAPPAKRAEAAQAWAAWAAAPDAAVDAKLDQMLALLASPQSTELLAVLAQAQLKQVNMQEISLALSAGAGELIDAVAARDAELGQSLRVLLSDAVAWLPKAGLDDPARLRGALAALAGASQALKVANAAELRGVAYDELLKRLGPALGKVKQALAAYDVQVDRGLESLALADVAGSGDQRSARLTLTAFGREHAFPLKLRLVDGAWEVDTAAFTPLPVPPAPPLTP